MEKRTTLDRIRNVHGCLTGAYAMMAQAEASDSDAEISSCYGQVARSLEFAENDAELTDDMTDAERAAMKSASFGIVECRRVFEEQERSNNG